MQCFFFKLKLFASSDTINYFSLVLRLLNCCNIGFVQEFPGFCKSAIELYRTRLTVHIYFTFIWAVPSMYRSCYYRFPQKWDTRPYWSKSGLSTIQRLAPLRTITTTKVPEVDFRTYTAVYLYNIGTHSHCRRS